MDGEGFAKDRADGHARIERGERVLEHDLHVAPHGAQVAAGKAKHVLSVKGDLAFAGFDEAQHAARRGRLAATGLADQSERFAAVDRKRHAVHRVNAPDLARKQAALDGKMLLQAGDAQQGFAHALAPCVASR